MLSIDLSPKKANELQKLAFHFALCCIVKEHGQIRLSLNPRIAGRNTIAANSDIATCTDSCYVTVAGG
jgi:hypothetical protein